jgi:predicted DNA-binding transcriptional regulator YafY
VESSSARLLGLLSLLQARPRWSAPELADRLGITTRTVRRDVVRLRDLGYPVHGGAGRDGGYELGAGGTLPPLLLTDDESVAVAVGLRAAASGAVAGYEQAAVAAMAKLEQVLPARLRERVLALNDAIVLVRPGSGPSTDPEVLLTVAQGCRRSERLRFGYQDGDGHITERRAEPYGVVSTDRRWYLVALDLDRRDWRTFRVDRINSPALTGHRFVPTAGVDAAAMIVERLASLPYQWQAEVRLATDRRTAEAEIPRTVGIVDEVDGDTILRIGANELDWLARYVASLPFDAEVLDPPELRAAVREVARRLLDTNRPGGRRRGAQVSGKPASRRLSDPAVP